MFLRLTTASRMNASYSWDARSIRSCCSVSSSVTPERWVARKMPRLASSVIDQTSSLGRRSVIATVPGVVAGGRTICARSPLGSEAERSGVASSMRCRVEFAINLASRAHQSKSAKGNGRRSQPMRVSTKASPGRLMQTSVTSGSARIGRRARKLSSSAEVEGGASALDPPVMGYPQISSPNSRRAAHRRDENPHPAPQKPECDPPEPW